MDCIFARRSTLLAAATATLFTGGCKENDGQPVNRDAHAKELVQVVCDAFLACDCADETTLLDDDTQCPAALQPGVEAAMANAADLGMRFYPGCLERYDALLDIVACNTGFEVDGMFEAGDARLRQLSDELGHCKLLAGSMGRGQSCVPVGVPGGGLIGDNCEHDLVCADGLCRPFPTTQGHWCGGLLDCPGDLACLDPDADGVLTCEPRATLGRPCNPHDGLGCLEDLFCDGKELTCAELPEAGEPCIDDPFASASCSSEAVCVGDTCERLLAVGDSCMSGVCNPQLAYCNTTSYECVALPGKGDECTESSGQCLPGLTCLGEGADVECQEDPPMVCGLPDTVGVCIYQEDGICDEPEGTDLCAEGTDPIDCAGVSDSDSDSGPDTTESGTDGSDTGFTTTGDTDGGFCESFGDGVCDEPEGTGLCAEGTDPLDCLDDGTTGETAGDSSGVEEAICSNGIIEPGEQCDSADLDGFDCVSFGYTGGTLYCDAVTCEFDTSFCT